MCAVSLCLVPPGCGLWQDVEGKALQEVRCSPAPEKRGGRLVVCAGGVQKYNSARIVVQI